MGPFGLDACKKMENRVLKQIMSLMIFFFLLAPNLFAHGISASDKEAMLSGGIMAFTWLGASHMLTGYDHLLFIFGVIFFLSGIKDVFKYITVFTIGHSITLIFATILKISANSYLIDAVIALSVCYKGFENIDGFKKYLNIKSPNLSGVVFGFGLIHGFGLSTRLQQLPIDGDQLIGQILSFNVGVELGQIFALILMLTLMNGWKKNQSFKKFSSCSNHALILAGFLLFLMQMHGFLHTTYPDDFGFPQDSHIHAHEDMQTEVQSHHENL